MAQLQVVWRFKQGYENRSSVVSSTVTAYEVSIARVGACSSHLSCIAVNSPRARSRVRGAVVPSSPVVPSKVFTARCDQPAAAEALMSETPARHLVRPPLVRARRHRVDAVDERTTSAPHHARC